MSNQWRYECADCGEQFETEHGNHASRRMAEILRDRDGLVELAETLNKHSVLIANVDAFLHPGEHWPAGRLAWWFRSHQGHRILLLDEGNREYGHCAARVACSGGCGHPRYCTLPPGHDGDHDPDAVAPAPPLR